MFLLDMQSKVPIYEQIQMQILRFIDVGVLSPGDKLPSIRSLAHDNGINPNTVAKAFAELEKNGYVRSIPKKGYYVAEQQGADLREDRIRKVLTTLRDSGISRAEIDACLDEIYKGGR
ncbi:MAG: GntR family transcriptional regulator [Anaerovoracaceae bacterium]